VQALATAARDYRAWCGAWPTHGDLLERAPTLPAVDRWGRAFRYTVREGGLEVRSGGVDGVLATADDLVATAADMSR
jgi:hypothetical protein